MAMKSRKLIVRGALVVAGVALVFGGGAAVGFYWLPARFPGQRQPAPCEDVTDRIPATGRLEPAGGFIDIHGPTGDRIASIEVERGKLVTEETVLAKLESYRDRDAEVQYSKTQRDEAKARIAAVEAQAEAQQREADLRKEQLAELDLLDIKAQQAKVDAIRSQLVKAEDDLKNMYSLQSTPGMGVSPQELENQKVLVQKTRKELEASVALLDKLKKAKDFNQVAAEEQEKTAQKTLDRMKKEVPLASLEKNLELARARLERSQIKARVQGRVLEVLARKGETVGPKPIFRLANTANMVVIAEVDERNIEKLREMAAKGNVRVEISSRAFGKKTFTGTIEHISNMVAKSPIPEIDPKKEADRRVFEVRVKPSEEFNEVARNYVNLPVNVDFYPRDNGGLER